MKAHLIKSNVNQGSALLVTLFTCGLLGTMLFIVHVVPPSVETKIGALLPPAGSGVKADPAICCRSAGLTARFGSLS